MGIPAPPDLEPKVDRIFSSALGPGITDIARTVIGAPFRIADKVKNTAFGVLNTVIGR
jgi:hypothetical protein